MEVGPPPSACNISTVARQNTGPPIIAPISAFPSQQLNAIASVISKNASTHKRSHSPCSNECIKKLKNGGKVRSSWHSEVQVLLKGGHWVEGVRE